MCKLKAISSYCLSMTSNVSFGFASSETILSIYLLPKSMYSQSLIAAGVVFSEIFYSFVGVPSVFERYACPCFVRSGFPDVKVVVFISYS